MEEAVSTEGTKSPGNVEEEGSTSKDTTEPSGDEKSPTTAKFDESFLVIDGAIKDDTRSESPEVIEIPPKSSESDKTPGDSKTNKPSEDVHVKTERAPPEETTAAKSPEGDECNGDDMADLTAPSPDVPVPMGGADSPDARTKTPDITTNPVGTTESTGEEAVAAKAATTTEHGTGSGLANSVEDASANSAAASTTSAAAHATTAVHVAAGKPSQPLPGKPHVARSSPHVSPKPSPRHSPRVMTPRTT